MYIYIIQFIRIGNIIIIFYPVYIFLPRAAQRREIITHAESENRLLWRGVRRLNHLNIRICTQIL